MKNSIQLKWKIRNISSHNKNKILENKVGNLEFHEDGSRADSWNQAVIQWKKLRIKEGVWGINRPHRTFRCFAYVSAYTYIQYIYIYMYWMNDNKMEGCPGGWHGHITWRCGAGFRGNAWQKIQASRKGYGPYSEWSTTTSALPMYHAQIDLAYG